MAVRRRELVRLLSLTFLHGVFGWYPAGSSAPRYQGRTRSVISMDANRQVALGSIGLGALALNRIFLAGSLPIDSQSRADLLCLCAMCGLLLDGLSVREIDPRSATSASLKGTRGVSVAKQLTEDELRSATWIAAAIVDSIPEACTVIAWTKRKPVVRYGLLGDAALDLESQTFRDAIKLAPDETYLPDLQALPARVEFGCLPRFTPAALILPVDSETGVLVACDKKRALSPKDIAWIRGFAQRLV